MDVSFHHTIDVEDLEGLKKRVTITYDAEGVNRAKNDAAKAVGKQVQIKGFRKGKAPAALVQNYCRSQIDLTTTSMLTQKGYLHACNEHQLLVLNEPEFEEPDYTDDGGFKTQFVIEVRPKIDPSGYVGLQLEKAEVDKEQIFEQLLENLRQSHVADQQVEVVEDRTMTTVDFDVLVDERVVNSGAAQPFFVTEAGSPPFGSNLIGKSVGDVCVENITLPKEYEEHGGKDAEVKITIKSAVKKVEPNDEQLVASAEAPSYEELVKVLRQQTESIAKERQVASLEELAIDKLLELHEFEVPESWVEAEKKYMLGQFGVEEAPDENTGKFVNDMAVRNVRRTFLLEAIYDEEPSLKLTNEDVNAILESEAKSHGVSTMVVKKEWQEKNMVDSVLASIKHKKVMSFIVGQAQVVDQQQETPVITSEVDIPENPMGDVQLEEEE